MAELWEQFRRRRIVQIALAYVAVGWAILEGLDFLRGTFDWPVVIVRVATILVVTGLFVALVVSWFHGEKGHQRAPPVEIVLIALLVVAGLGASVTVMLQMPATQTAEEPVPQGAPVAELKEGWVGVLPFTNLSGDPDQDFFAAGMTLEINTALGSLGGLRVISWGSTAQFAERQGLEWRQIAGRLGVASLVDGSVRISGDALRVNAQLVDARTGEQLWAAQYDETLSAAAVFEIQTDVARRVAIAVMSTADSALSYDRRPTDNLEAYQAYLQGLHAFQGADPSGLTTAMVWLDRALELDPGFALAHAAYADVWLASAHFGTPPHLAFPNGLAAARRALELDPELGDAHVVLADVLFHYEWDWAGAEREFLRGQVLGSAFSTTHWWYAGLLSALGRHEEAIAEVEMARSLDPLSPIGHAFAGQVYAYAGRYDEGEAALERALELNPAAAFAHANKAVLLHAAGRPLEAVDAAREAARLAPGPNLGVLAALQAYAGEAEEARLTLSRLEALAGGLGDDRYVPPYTIAPAYVALGDLDRALDLLEESAELRDAALIWVDVNPMFDPLRAEPRYVALIQRMGLGG
ncbi:MAG: tetratricopeptide repeat protein [Longimicrobiales bacterium]|nr:tetratricopeptide repeat protein [Longimicrobiales bacterium]